MTTLSPSARSRPENIEILKHNSGMLGERDREFAASLVASESRGLTEKQWFWIDQLASRAVARIADHGHRTGRCYLCRRKLTDPKSIKYGYGPVCAHNNALPYG